MTNNILKIVGAIGTEECGWQKVQRLLAGDNESTEGILLTTDEISLLKEIIGEVIQ